jgi:hypothetical protein
MSILIKTAGWLGSVLAILALMIALLKQIITFIGFLTMVIKVGIVLLFILVFVGIGFLALRAFQSNQKSKSN